MNPRIISMIGLGDILLVLLLACCSFPATARAEASGKRIRVVFRFDDPSAKSCTDIEARLIEIFRRNKMTCTWGVVPFATSEGITGSDARASLPWPKEKLELFAEAARAGVLEIALHGHAHENHGSASSFTEFAMLPYEEQLGKIRAGKRFLEEQLGVEVAIFVPPWNRYDSNTLKAIEAERFRCVSASYGGACDASSTMTYLPCTIGSPAELEHAIAVARNISDPDPVIVVLFHQFDFVEFPQSRGRGVMSLDRFESLLRWVGRQPDIQVVRMRDITDASARNYIGLRHFADLNKKLPAMLRIASVAPFYLSEGFVSRWSVIMKTLLYGFYAAVFVLVGIVSFASVQLGFRKVYLASQSPYLLLGFLFASGPFTLLPGLIWPYYGLGSGSRGLLSIVIVLGYWAGTWSAAFRRDRTS